MVIHKTIELDKNNWMLVQQVGGYWPSVMFGRSGHKESMEFLDGVRYFDNSFAEYVCREYLRFIGDDNK